MICVEFLCAGLRIAGGEGIFKRFGWGSGEELDVVGIDFDGGGDEAGDFDDEAALAHAFDRQEASLVAVEHAADYAHCLAIHGGGDFAGAVIDGVLVFGDGEYEAGHFVVAHCHGLVASVSAEIAVLQCR